MVEVSIVGDRLRLDVEGLDKLWSFRSHIELPLDHVVTARIDPEAARGWWHGIRLLGTFVPGVLSAGTFYKDGMVFFDVHDPDQTIVIELTHEHYRRLIVEVADPNAAVATIRAALTAA